MVTQIRRSTSIGDIWDPLSIISHHFSSNCCGFSLGILYSSSITAGTSDNGSGVLYFHANICQILWFGFFCFFFGQFYFLNSSSSHFPYFLNTCTASSLAQVSFSFSFSFLIHKSHSPSMLNNLIFSIYISHHQSWGSSSGFTERDVSGWNPETWMDKTYIYFHQTNWTLVFPPIMNVTNKWQ